MDEDLRKLGFIGYEIDIYKTLLIEGSLKGGEVSKKSNVPHGRTYEILNILADKGFVQIIKTKPKIFKAVDPEIAINVFIAQKHEELENLKEKLPKNLKGLKKLRPLPKTEEKITVLQGKQVLEPIILQELEKVKKYFKRMFTFEYLPYEIIRKETELAKKGIKFQILATLLNKETFTSMKKAAQLGYEVKYYPVEELRISIIDGEQSMINLINKNNPNNRTVILIESKELTKALEHYFDTIWTKAKLIKNTTSLKELE